MTGPPTGPPGTGTSRTGPVGTDQAAPVRWGILGTGRIAAKFTEDLALVPDARAHAVGSRSPGTARAYADRFGIRHAYGSWADLVADPDVDVVYVATPHSAHAAATRLCLEAGKPVLCEKPITLDQPAARDLVELAGRRGVFLMEAMWMRCNPLVRQVVELVGSGAIGTVTAVHADFGMGGEFPPGHRLLEPALGGGALLDVGIYPVALAHLLLGVPAEIRSWARLTAAGVDANTAILFGYPTGAVAVLSCGFVGETARRAAITGTAGRIELDARFWRPTTATVHRPDAEPTVLRHEEVGWGYQYEAAEVQRCLRAGELASPMVPHAATLEVMGLLDAVRAQIGVAYQ